MQGQSITFSEELQRGRYSGEVENRYGGRHGRPGQEWFNSPYYPDNPATDGLTLPILKWKLKVERTH